MTDSVAQSRSRAKRESYSVRLTQTLGQRLDRHIRWQKRHATPTSVYRSRAAAVRWLLHFAIDAVEQAHEDRITASDLASLFAQRPSNRPIHTSR